MQNPPPDSGSADAAARVQISNQIHLWLDEPVDWSRKMRWLRLSGWCVAKRNGPLTAIRAQLRGQTFPGYFDRDRPEVAAHVGMPDAPRRCGFTIDVRVPFGRGRLELQVARADGRWLKAYARNVWGPAVVSASERKSRRELEAADLRRRFHFWFDTPTDWSRPVRHLRISGWCAAATGEPIVELHGRIARQVFPANYGFVRHDVVAALEGGRSALQSGFSLDVEAPRLGGELVLEARRAHGEWEPFFKQRLRGAWLTPSRSTELEEVGNYAEWIHRYDTRRAADRRNIRQHIARFARRPLISVIMPVYEPEAEHLRAAIESVRAQLYPHWQLCIADDASPSPYVRRILSRFAARDCRIRVLYREANVGIATASNDALGLTTGDFVALLDHDDTLAPAALYFVAHEINQHPETQLIYSDEDKLDVLGRRTNPHFKTDWNHTLFLAQNYFSHLGVFKTELIKEAGFRAGFEGSQDYDLVLRCAEKVERRQIRHIPHVLYHWRMSEKSAALNFNAKPHARAAAIRAVEEHLKRSGIAAEVTSSGDENFRRVRYFLPDDKPRVAIIILTRNLVDLLRPCVESLLSQTTYPNFEIVLLDNGSEEKAALSFLAGIERDPRVRVLRRAAAFNFGQLNNLVVRGVEADFVALLNNDLTIITPGWLDEMVSQALQPGVGAVGARLLYPDDHIQHAGVILDGGGVAAHAHKGLPRANHGYFARAILAQELSAVTAACLLVRRSAYLEIGGFNAEHLKIAFNDVDFCLRLRERGYRIIYTPYAELYHFESASRGLEDTVAKNTRFEAEIKYMRDTWGDALRQDPAYNPNFSPVPADFTLAFPPRAERPWSRP